MKKFCFMLCFLPCIVLQIHAQVQEKPTRGFLMTRVSTTERTDPVKFPSTTPRGTQVYDTDTKSFWYWDGTKWLEKPSASKADTTNDHWKNDVGQLKLAYRSDGTLRTAGSELVIKDDGKVGLGTTAPAWKLDVQGSSAIGQFKRISNRSLEGGTILLSQARGSIGSETDVKNNDFVGKVQFRGRIGGSDEDLAALAFVIDDITNKTGHYSFLKNDLFTEIMTIKTGNGNVGIGTSSPLSRLHINGGAEAQAAGEDLLTLQAAYNSDIPGSGSTIRFTNNSVSADAAAIRTHTTGTSAVAMSLQTGYGTGTLQDRLTIANNGNVGIGTSAPAARLHTNGSLKFGNLPSSASTPKLLGISDVGDVSTREVSDFYPKVLAGGNGTDAITTAVAANTSGTAEPQIATRSFTLARKSLVQIRYNIGVTEIKTADGNGLGDGRSKHIGLNVGVYNGTGSTATLFGGWETDGFSFTNAGDDYTYGYFFLNQTIFKELPAGTYEVRFKARVFSLDSVGVSAKYGSNSADRIDIIATPML